MFCHLFQKDFTESIAEEAEIKMFHNTPDGMIACPAFRNEGMDMRVPLEVPAESVEDADEPWGEVFRFVDFVEHPQDDISDGVKETVQKGSVFKKEITEFFRYGKNAVTVGTGNQFA